MLAGFSTILQIWWSVVFPICQTMIILRNAYVFLTRALCTQMSYQFLVFELSVGGSVLIRKIIPTTRWVDVVSRAERARGGRLLGGVSQEKQIKQ